MLESKPSDFLRTSEYYLVDASTVLEGGVDSCVPTKKA
jgi:hypothetical protein